MLTTTKPVNQTFKRITLAAACFAAVSLMHPAHASADARDDQFLAALSAQGISAAPDQLTSFAHTMCDVGGGMGAIGPQYGLMASAGLSPQQVASVVVAAYRTYCPAKLSTIPPFMLPPA